jgi:hypothetical protein
LQPGTGEKKGERERMSLSTREGEAGREREREREREALDRTLLFTAAQPSIKAA